MRWRGLTPTLSPPPKNGEGAPHTDIETIVSLPLFRGTGVGGDPHRRRVENLTK